MHNQAMPWCGSLQKWLHSAHFLNPEEGVQDTRHLKEQAFTVRAKKKATAEQHRSGFETCQMLTGIVWCFKKTVSLKATPRAGKEANSFFLQFDISELWENLRIGVLPHSPPTLQNYWLWNLINSSICSRCTGIGLENQGRLLLQ